MKRKYKSRIRKYPKGGFIKALEDVGKGALDSILTPAEALAGDFYQPDYSTKVGKGFGEVTKVTDKLAAIAAPIAASAIAGPVAGQAVSTAQNIVGDMVDTPDEKEAARLANIQPIQDNTNTTNDPFNYFAEGGLTNPFNPMATIEVEGKELEVSNGKVLKDFKKEAKHEDGGYTYNAQTGKVIIPSKLRDRYLEGDNITRKSIEAKLVNDQAKRETQDRTARFDKYRKGGGIYIKPSKRGTFTAAASKHDMGVQEFASKVLANKGSYSSAMVKKANFARNAAKWHREGGEVSDDEKPNTTKLYSTPNPKRPSLTPEQINKSNTLTGPNKVKYLLQVAPEETKNLLAGKARKFEHGGTPTSYIRYDENNNPITADQQYGTSFDNTTFLPNGMSIPNYVLDRYGTQNADFSNYVNAPENYQRENTPQYVPAPTPNSPEYLLGNNPWDKPALDSFYKGAPDTSLNDTGAGDNPSNFGKILRTAGELAPIGYNLYRGLQKPTTLKQEDYQNPYENKVRDLYANRKIDMTPIENEIRDTYSIGLSNIGKGTKSSGQVLSGKSALFASRMNALAKAKLAAQQANNQYRGEEANALSGLGDRYAARKLGITDINMRSRAARNAFLGQAASDISQYSQGTNRDNIYQNMLENVFTDYFYNRDKQRYNYRQK